MTMPRYWNPCSYLPRRLQIVASLTAFVLFCIIFLGTSSSDTTVDPYLNQVPFGPQLQAGAHQVVDTFPKLPKELPHVNTPQWLNPFRGPAHTPPPEQANSSSGEARWYSDFKWRNPFSSSVTLDEERAVLPPVVERPPIYTYFDLSSKKDDKSKHAEQELLHIWRRAWWAQGFKPVVLGRPEAMNNPQYRAVQTLELEPEMEAEMMRWLAWGNMGTGILSNWLALPMARFDDPLLTFLRRREYPALTRYEGLESGLFVGGKDDIEKAIKAAVSSRSIKTAKSMVDAVPHNTFEIDSEHSGVAFYSSSTISEKYKNIKTKLDKPSQVAEGLAMLPSLINSHLHMTWQNTFSSGIAVLKPLPERTTSLIEPAIDIARNLSQCPESPIPASCPPNRPRCKPCVSSQMLITTPPVFRNTSTLFTIGTVPHPYTLNAVRHSRDSMDVRFIRRETVRDAWILAATKELLGTGISSFARLISLKDAVASEYGSSKSIWLNAEKPPSADNEKDMAELDWHFGFQIPREPMDDGKSETPVPGPERRPPPPKTEFGDGPALTPEELAKERAYLEKAKMFMSKAERGSKKDPLKSVKDIVEAWNLADAEAWKFVRAYNARRRVERQKWEEEEEAFLGKGIFDRWMDKLT